MGKPENTVDQRMTDLADAEDGGGCHCCGGLGDGEQALWEVALAKREATADAPMPAPAETPPEPKVVARQSS